MSRWGLRRYIQRIALASLPALGASACNGPAAVADGGADLAVPLDFGLACEQVPTDPSSCYWFTFVDANWPADMMATYQWAADGGVDGGDPCAPCKFHDRADAWCGICLTQATACGAAYACAVLDCTEQCMASGRRPEGLVRPRVASPTKTGEWFARMAHLESASVPAFARLALELAAHRAPESLIALARRALRDEERHARMMTDLARAAGARVPPVEMESMSVRPLEAVAIENAVEGCVRESFGALVAAEQARKVRDPVLSRILSGIAVDETRHGELAWAVDRWASRSLSGPARRRVEQARVTELRAVLKGA
jgi:hypothetical protein